MKNILLAAGLLALAFDIASAQTFGGITGEVKDPSGSIALSAAVTAINTATNVSRSTVTNDAGIYSFPSLNPGPYQVKVSAPGFETAVRTNIDLQVQQTARIDFTLAVGQATQTIEVSANNELLTTENATVGTVIEQERIVELPLNGRNFFSLVALSPQRELRFRPRRAGRRPPRRHSLQPHDFALRRARHLVQLHAGWHHQHRRRFQYLHHAALGRRAAGIQGSVRHLSRGVRPRSRPGQCFHQVRHQLPIHGTVFEFLRNNALDARSYDFLSSTRSATNPSPANTPFRQNQYGFTLAGPIRIPKVFNGKNRLFFMFNYRGFQVPHHHYIRSPPP